MTATVETLDGLLRRVNLDLNREQVESEVAKRLARLSKTVRMNGFRPGKAPMKVVAAQYGGEVRREVLGHALQQAFQQVVAENSLSVAGYPQYAQGENGTFVATFEVFPEIKVGDLSGIKVTRPVADVADADIDRTLDVLIKQRVQFHAVERAARTGDRVHVDYVGRIDGETFPGGEAKDFPLVLGEGRTLPSFEAGLDGLAAGETRSFEVSFPADYFAKELAGKTAVFEATMKSVHEAHFPPVDEAFAASLGVHEGGVAKLREEIASNLSREAKRRINARIKEQVMNGLLESSPFDVPASLVAMERRGLHEKAVADLKARGMKEADIKLGEDVFEAQARRRVALGLLMTVLVRENGITVQEDQVRAMVDEFAQSYEDPAEVVAWYYQDADRLNEVRSLVLEENVVAWALGKAQVTDEPITLEKLMGNN